MLKMTYQARNNFTNILRLLSIEEGHIILEEVKKSNKFGHKLTDIKVTTSTINGVEVRSIIMEFKHFFNYVLVGVEFPSGEILYMNY